MKRILIVDDEPHLCLLYETELHRAGYETMSATSGQQCQEYVETMSPDLVILDIRMPGVDGVEVLQWLSVHHKNIPVIINTAFKSYTSNYLTWVADAFLTKSANLQELTDTVKDLLGVAQATPRGKRTPQKQGTASHEGTHRFVSIT